MNDEVRITCEICEDLLPLVEDHVASEESRRAVLSHISTCRECQNRYPALAGFYAVQEETRDTNTENSEIRDTNAKTRSTRSINTEKSEIRDTNAQTRSTRSTNTEKSRSRQIDAPAEKDDQRILTSIREKLSIGLLLCISISLLLGVLIVVSEPSSPWLMLIIFPLICGFVYWTGGRAWRWVPVVAALLWILVTLIMHRQYTANWKAAILDSVVSAIFPLILCCVGALAAALLKYAFKGELK